VCPSEAKVRVGVGAAYARPAVAEHTSTRARSMADILRVWMFAFFIRLHLVFLKLGISYFQSVKKSLKDFEFLFMIL
jgi:hypothetical protein